MASGGTEFQLRKRLDLSLAVLNQYSSLLDSYILDFFIEHHYENLPKSWIEFFQTLSIEELSRFLNIQNCTHNRIWPLSLITLRYLIKFLSFTRKPNKKEKCEGDCKTEYASKTKNKKRIQNEIDIKSNEKYPQSGPSEKLKILFTKHVKSKKRHEVWKMAETTAEVARASGVNHVVDIGSGLGHLSRVAGYAFGLNMLSVESQKILSEEARKLDRDLEITLNKHISKKEVEVIVSKQPIHIQKTVTCDIQKNEFLQFIRMSFSKTGSNFKFGMIGLHPCGNLAVKMLKLFIQCEDVLFINIACCCYHKLTALSDNNVDEFPMSHSFKRTCFKLSYEALALACHSLEAYCKRLEMNDYNHLKIHCYRATLEHIINKNWPHLRRSALCNVKYVTDLTFPNYCKNALKKLQIVVPQEDIASQETLQHLSQWKNVVLYYSLRLLLAPLVETIILLDRMLYLMEYGYECKVEAAFDPEISPRNFVLIAKK